MKAHKRQFLIGNQPKHVREDWKTVQLGEALYLSICPDLPVATAKDENGDVWHLLGFAVQTNKEKGDPATEIRRSSNAEICEIYKSWSGRWVLISATEIHMDCCGLLGCFYATIRDARWVSSSLAILQEIGDLTPNSEVLKHKSGMEWYPLPSSKFEGVSKLLPSQILNVKTFHIRPRTLPKPINGLEYDKIIEGLKEKLKLAAANSCRFSDQSFIPLTAGYDSRVVLATARYAGIKIRSYTTGHHYISYADVALPFKLSKAAGYHHMYIKKAKFSKEKEVLYDYHTARNIDDIDRTKFSHGQWDHFGKGDVVLRGGIFEVGRCFYWRRMSSEVTIESMIKVMRIKHHPESSSIKALVEWMKWVDQTPTEGLDWRDRFYLEQRVAGWLSSIEQSLDLTETERSYIINCQDIISLLLSIPVEKRKSSAHHIDLIKEMFPALLRYPINPPDPAFKRLQKKIIRMSKLPLQELFTKLIRKFN